MDGSHVKGVAEDKLDALLAAEVGEPVPGEHTLGAHDEVFSVGLDGRQKGIGSALQVPLEQDLAVLIEDAEVEGLGVQVDAGVVAMGLVVESHGPLLTRLG